MTALIADDGGSSVDLTRFLTPQVITALLIAVAVLLVLVAIAAWMIARSVRRRGWLNRDVVERGILSVKAQTLPPGPAREVAGLRLELRAAGAQTRRTLESARESGCPTGELPELFRRIERVADALDGELALLEHADDGRTAASLTAARQRSDEVLRAMERIRGAATATMGDLSGDELRSVEEELNIELTALRAGVETLRKLDGPSL